MSTLEDLQQQFEQKLEAEVRRRRGESGPRSPLDAGFEQRVRDYEARLQARVAARRRESQAYLDALWAGGSSGSALAAPPFAAPPFIPPRPRIALDGEPALREMDGLMADEFHLARYFPHVSLDAYPTVYCETLEEYFQPYVELLDVSESTRRALIERMSAEAERAAAERGGGQFGVHWPGRGCYVNGWLFAHGRAPNARAALADPRILPHILGTVAHEKLGHGFVGEYTLLGQEKKKLGAWRYDIARRFDVRIADTPEGALLAEKEGQVYVTSQLLEEGWATWIEHHLRRRLAEAGVGAEAAPTPSADPYNLAAVSSALALLARTAEDARAREVAAALLPALEVLFLSPEPDPADIHAAVLLLQTHSPAVDEAFARRLRQPIRYVVGYLLLRELEARLGTLCLPYAVCIAASITYGLDKVAAVDLHRLVSQNPRLNVDSRLAHLRLLDLAGRGDVGELARRAHEELNLAVPEELR